MEKKSQGQPGRAPQSVNPAPTLNLCESRLSTIIKSLQNFENRKRLTDKMLQNYIDQLDEMTQEISQLALRLPKTESGRFNKLLRHIFAAIRKFDSAKKALPRNNHLSHIDEALIKLHNAISECR